MVVSTDNYCPSELSIQSANIEGWFPGKCSLTVWKVSQCFCHEVKYFFKVLIRKDDSNRDWRPHGNIWMIRQTEIGRWYIYIYMYLSIHHTTTCHALSCFPHCDEMRPPKIWAKINFSPSRFYSQVFIIAVRKFYNIKMDSGEPVWHVLDSVHQ